MIGRADTSYRGVRVMVLGAAGFIGRWVARALAERGALLELVVRDRADLEDPDAVSGLVARYRPAIVFNLAGYGVDPSERDATHAERLNAELPAILAAAMAENDDAGWSGQQVVHAGSALEYGTAAGDLNERTAGTPTTLYGRTKLDGTTRLHEAAHRLGIHATTGRLFTVYGPGEHPGRLLPTLLEAARATGPIPLTAGTQRRDFTWVGDAAEGLLRLGALPAPSRDIVNVATGQLTTVRQFVEAAADVIGIDRGRLAFGAIATRQEEMAHDDVNIERLRQLTGWAPATSLPDGLHQTLPARTWRP